MDLVCVCCVMRRYAGETEFWLLADELRVAIAIFTAEDIGFHHVMTYGATYEERGRSCISLLWHRGAGGSGAGNHYDLLLQA